MRQASRAAHLPLRDKGPGTAKAKAGERGPWDDTHDKHLSILMHSRICFLQIILSFYFTDGDR